MRRITALLLAVIMALSLVVVAGAKTGGTVKLYIEPKTTEKDQTEIEFNIYLEPQSDVDEIGAFQFAVKGRNCTIQQKPTYVDESLKYKAEDGYFEKYGGNGGSITDNTYKFYAAGTAKQDYTDETGDHKAHIWKKGSEDFKKTLIVTLKVTMEAGKKSCGLDVVTEGSERFTVGMENDDGTVQGIHNAVIGENKGYGVKKGDVNGDNVINANDLTALARIVGQIDSIPNDTVKICADVTNDGIINAEDVTKLARYIGQIISTLD